MEKDEIVEAFKLSRISKVWKDPQKAKDWGEMGWIMAFIFGMAFVILIWVEIEIIS